MERRTSVRLGRGDERMSSLDWNPDRGEVNSRGTLVFSGSLTCQGKRGSILLVIGNTKCEIHLKSDCCWRPPTRANSPFLYCNGCGDPFKWVGRKLHSGTHLPTLNEESLRGLPILDSVDPYEAIIVTNEFLTEVEKAQRWARNFRNLSRREIDNLGDVYWFDIMEWDEQRDWLSVLEDYEESNR